MFSTEITKMIDDFHNHVWMFFPTKNMVTDSDNNKKNPVGFLSSSLSMLLRNETKWNKITILWHDHHHLFCRKFFFHFCKTWKFTLFFFPKQKQAKDTFSYDFFKYVKEKNMMKFQWCFLFSIKSNKSFIFGLVFGWTDSRLLFCN